MKNIFLVITTVFLIVKSTNSRPQYGYHQSAARSFPISNQQNSYFNRLSSNDYLSHRTDNSGFFQPQDESVEPRIKHKHKQKKKHKNQNQNFPQQQPLLYSNPCQFRYRSSSGRNNERDESPQGRFFWDLNVYNIYPRPQQQSVLPVFGGLPISPLGALGCGIGLADTPNLNSLSLAGLSGFQNNGNGHSHKKEKPILNYLLGLGGSGGGNDGDSQVIDPVYNDPKPVIEDNGDDPMSTRPIAGMIGQIGQVVGGVSDRVNDAIQILSGNGPRGSIIRDIYNSYRYF